ncbi:domain di-copper centre [Penicillium alfredii]|uniref:Domain di-copper centre n=1 Tax=Penicillium alfredii TaxID=1506179 RepID=A0A9W9KQ89_9EURO|nr:domain di-copper centre [Penicillium alfredii]KAJ5115229.1 domain di-copper centre [Penicillium alfredii]
MAFLKTAWLVFALGVLAPVALSSPAPWRCNPSTVALRKEWGQFTRLERKAYISAIQCMQQKPKQLPASEFPGVRNRFDDFVATHINYTLQVHYSGLFLPWHRHYIWLWERAIRDECEYTGYLPYWNWPLWVDNLAASPLFDCSETSLSGDGEFDSSEEDISNANITIPRGTGGGCVRCGPFKDMQIHMGPFSRNLVSLTEIPSPGFEYNPRCFVRSLNLFVATHYTNATLVDRLMASSDIVDFQTVVDHWPARPDGVFGVHGGGHFSLGSTFQDLFASTQDPVFMLHHAMIDRLWAKWQAMDAKNRRYAVNGTTTILNPPWGKPVTMDLEMDFGILGRSRSVREVMNPMTDGYCYRYT